jgi:hypothetical protein
MKIVHIDEVPMEDRLSGGREGTWKRRRVLRVEPDGPGGFSLVVYYHNGSFYSPRHHHSFDQFRYQLEGEADFDRNGKMTPGVLGYFPEGAFYGPTSGPAHTVAVLQFGGPSGAGYMGAQQHRQAVEALQAVGVFEKGIFHRNPDVAGKKNQDAYEAVWEQANQRRLVYPKPQYAAPIMMDSNQCPWMPLDGVPAVAEKPLGTFTNCKIHAARYQLDPGAKFVATDRGIYLVLAGAGTIDGAPVRALTTIYLDENEQGTFEATQPTDILLMGMPSVKLMGKQAPAPLQYETVE